MPVQLLAQLREEALDSPARCLPGSLPASKAAEAADPVPDRLDQAQQEAPPVPTKAGPSEVHKEPCLQPAPPRPEGMSLGGPLARASLSQTTTSTGMLSVCIRACVHDTSHKT